ncbi:MAG: hypothetical protein ACK5QS_12690 [Pseudanabaenaceae cyanobacterium]
MCGGGIGGVNCWVADSAENWSAHPENY